MSSNTRTTRTTDASLDEEGVVARPKTFMEKWTEPPLRAPAPSFKEYPHLDIVRHGVLTEMAPLGQMPSTKLKKAAKSDTPKQFFQVKKPEPSVESTPRDNATREILTPEPINYVRRRSESRKTDDADYNPKTPKGQTSPQKSVVHSSAGRQSQTRQLSPSMSASPIKHESQLHRADRVVDSAVKAALLAKKYPTAYALRTLYDEHRENPRVTDLFIAVYNQSCTSAEEQEFSRLMKFKKREGKADDKAIKYFAEQGVNPFTIANIFSPSYSLTSASKRPGDLGILRSPHQDLGHVSKKHKGNNFGHYESPFATPAMNGQGNNLTVDNLNQQNQNQIQSNKDAAPGLDMARSKSQSTSSSLSSIDEELLRENFAPSGHGAGISPGRPDGNTTTTKNSQAAAGHSKATENNNHAAAPTTSPARNSTHQHQPITHQKALGPKLHAFSTTTTTTTANSVPSPSSTPIPAINHNTNTPAASAANQTYNNTNMPSYLTDPLPSNFQHPPQNTHKAHKKQIGGVSRQIEAEIDRDRLSLLKKQAQKSTEQNGNLTLSWARGRFSTHDPYSESEGNHSVAVVPPPVKLRLRGKRKANDESDDLSSPTQFSFQADGPPGSLSNSRAGTPTTLGRPARKAKSGGLRTKTS
jgi:hypothetical protein